MELGRPICLATDASSSQVRSRIECLVKLFLKSIMTDKDVAIKPLSLISRTERNTGAYGEGIHLMDATYEKDLSIRNCGNGFFRDVVAVLLCTRRSLGIVASSKGLVAGRLVFEEHGGDMIDCSNLGSSAHPITADINLQQQFYSDARYILVIEKDAIFQRLVEERFFLKVPCIVMTAKGFPDLASRALLHRLHQEFPSLHIYALVDWRGLLLLSIHDFTAYKNHMYLNFVPHSFAEWMYNTWTCCRNPAGLAIICTYKFGSIRMGLEAPRYVCDVKWLGLRYKDVLTYVPDNALSSLTDRDVSQAKNLLTSKMLRNNEPYKQEILEMLAFGQKTEIEALYAHGYDFLAKFITEKIIQRGYI